MNLSDKQLAILACFLVFTILGCLVWWIEAHLKRTRRNRYVKPVGDSRSSIAEFKRIMGK